MDNNPKPAQKIETTQPVFKQLTQSTASPLSWWSIGILISALAAIILFAGFYVSVVKLSVDNAKNTDVTQALQKTTVQNGDALSAVKKDLGTIEQSTQENHDQLTTQAGTLAELRHVIQGNKNEWSVAEAYYLVRLANDHLQIGSNPTVVVNLLNAADQKIAETNDPKLLPLRKALASDISAFQALPAIDTSGLYLRIAALNNVIDKTPLPNMRPANAAPTKPEAPLAWWKRGWQQTVSALKQIVVVRYTQPGQPPFVAPDLQNYIYQNLHALLEQAMFAVVRGEPDIYHTSLAQAQAWLATYFLQDSPVTQSQIITLKELQAINIKPELPPLTASLDAFKDQAASATSTETTSASTSSKQE